MLRCIGYLVLSYQETKNVLYKGDFMVFLALLGMIIGFTASNVEKTNELEKQLKESRELASEKQADKKEENNK